ncbi:hypothetical protein ABWI01_07320 [Oceanicaulis alexandrii]
MSKKGAQNLWWFCKRCGEVWKQSITKAMQLAWHLHLPEAPMIPEQCR